MSEADDLLRAFQADPVGTYNAVGAELSAAGYQTTDPGVAQMYADWQTQRELAAYDATVSRFAPTTLTSTRTCFTNRWQPLTAIGTRRSRCTAPTSPRLCCDTGSTQRARRRPSSSNMPVHDYRAEGLSPQDALHRAIAEAASMARRR